MNNKTVKSTAKSLEVASGPLAASTSFETQMKVVVPPPVPPKNGRGLFLRDTNNAGSENREGVERETEIEGKDNLFEWIQGIMLI